MKSVNSEYKVNTPRAVALPWDNDAPPSQEVQKPAPDDSIDKTESDLRTKLSKEGKDGRAGNYKTLTEKTEQDAKKWENVPSSRKGRITLEE